MEVINSIAVQFRLLSLNAAIEATKSGSAGKGFAVVADEMSVLSEKTNQSLEDIKSLIQISTSNVKEGEEVISNTHKLFNHHDGYHFSYQ